MFSRHSLSDDLDAVREEWAPEALVLDTQDFETIPPAQAEELGLFVESLRPATFPDEWLPPDAPTQLQRYVSDEFTVGMAGDGGVAWTTQTVPPTVFVKARMEGSPEPFLDFLVAEALVEAGLGVPEHFIGFFEERYRKLATATPLSPAETYQLATALYDAYLGLSTRPVFEAWADEYPRLYESWVDAGERLEPRLSELSREVATGQTSFAAELACSAVKHGLDLPIPFGALDTAAYRETGPEYAVAWTEKTFEKLRE